MRSRWPEPTPSSFPKFKKILIANRGEIAIRVMRAANELGKRTVAVYAEEDKLSLHRFKADEAYKIGEGLGPVAAYLSIDEIIRVAKMCGADAIHPGYGLAVREPRFRRCLRRRRHHLHRPQGRDHARPWRQGQRPPRRHRGGRAGDPRDRGAGRRHGRPSPKAEEIGYPLMLKASWGGGGRGMRPIDGPDELEEKVLRRPARGRSRLRQWRGLSGKDDPARPPCRGADPRRQARRSITCSSATARSSGATRRSWNAPPPPISAPPSARSSAKLGRKICKHVNYECAGTVEFLMDMDTGAFYFIEVNPRVQVEHTVTEEVTGIDIVQAQILIAEGKSLAEATGVASQYDVTLDGHAIQCRITTEDPPTTSSPITAASPPTAARPAWASGLTAARPIPARDHALLRLAAGEGHRLGADARGASRGWTARCASSASGACPPTSPSSRTC
jgi:pyruvate carboxylase